MEKGLEAAFCCSLKQYMDLLFLVVSIHSVYVSSKNEFVQTNPKNNVNVDMNIIWSGTNEQKVSKSLGKFWDDGNKMNHVPKEILQMNQAVILLIQKDATAIISTS